LHTVERIADVGRSHSVLFTSADVETGSGKNRSYLITYYAQG